MRKNSIVGTSSTVRSRSSESMSSDLVSRSLGARRSAPHRLGSSSKLHPRRLLIVLLQCPLLFLPQPEGFSLLAPLARPTLRNQRMPNASCRGHGLPSRYPVCKLSHSMPSSPQLAGCVGTQCSAYWCIQELLDPRYATSGCFQKVVEGSDMLRRAKCRDGSSGCWIR
ncbi:hypothetical protein OH77DRAFT_1424239 [Trametes cingulata]|nr:hypothetical protein OH77DRAFT_1424239 [Trametes cingulata]